MLHQLRQSRYLALGAVMVVVAMVCVAAGTWQIARFIQKHDDNNRLRTNAHAATAPVQTVLTPTSSAGSLAAGNKAELRRISATGSYIDADQLLVREQTVNSVVGYLVLTPFATDQPGRPVLLVVRGFIAADGEQIPAPNPAPAGTVTIIGRVQPSEQGNDRYGGDGVGQVRGINATRTAARLDTAVYGGYAELLGGQPGGSGLTTIPDPDLSNPAGGAIEPQHLAYVVQWYLFALLALAAPLVMARADSRRADEPVRRSPLRDALDAAAPTVEAAQEDQERAAKLADRYGSARRF